MMILPMPARLKRMESEVLVPNCSFYIIAEPNTTDTAEEILENTNSPTSEIDEPPVKTAIQQVVAGPPLLMIKKL